MGIDDQCNTFYDTLLTAQRESFAHAIVSPATRR